VDRPDQQFRAHRHRAIKRPAQMIASCWAGRQRAVR
jgi:hypothetical protein